MTTKILVAFLLVSILGACGKDNFDTKPKLTFKSVNTNVLRPNGVVTFILEITDAEGDIQDSMFVEKLTKNCAASTFKSGYRMPQFAGTKNLKADIEVSYAYNNPDLGFPLIQGPQCQGRNDTSTFRFYVKDRAKNVSDTVVSEVVVITRQ